MKISVVSPVYGCIDNLPELVVRLGKVLSTIADDYTIILVDDRCPRGSWDEVRRLAEEDDHVMGIRLSRNHGQHYAITAGLDYADGDWVVVMDCDLQDVPEEIAKMYAKAVEGYDLVVGKRSERTDGFFKKLGSQIFYSVLSYLTDTQHDTSIANFGIYSAKVVEVIRTYREQNRFFPLFVKLAGFNRLEMTVEHAERAAGKSTYNLRRLMNLAIDVIIAHSNKPLRMSIKFGFMVALVSTLYALFLVTRYLISGAIVEGWTSVMVSMFIMFGLTFSMFGIIGLYVGKIFDEVKDRPLYIIDEKVGTGQETLP